MVEMNAILEFIRRLREQDGQALAEFTLIVAFIAMVCIVAATALGGAIGVPYENFTSAFQGS
jgi:Flp pilus assembly pilin Flp